jgi:outer membrane lipoprotein-sorting protein
MRFSMPRFSMPRFSMPRFPMAFRCVLLLALRSLALHAEETPAAILDHARSVYAALNSYSDTGEVVKEYTATSRDRFTFTSYFNRAPRHFLFDYRSPSDRYVVWADPDAFRVWWKATGQVSEYPNPKNSGAILTSDYPTGASISKIVPMLYAKAGLPGAVAHFDPSRLAGAEVVAGNKCYRLDGSTSDSYGQTGKQINVRKLSVWIDSTTYLIRKTVEDAPAAPGALNRTTTTFEPQANPKLSDDVFKFAPPH